MFLNARSPTDKSRIGEQRVVRTIHWFQSKVTNIFFIFQIAPKRAEPMRPGQRVLDILFERPAECAPRHAVGFSARAGTVHPRCPLSGSDPPEIVDAPAQAMRTSRDDQVSAPQSALSRARAAAFAFVCTPWNGLDARLDHRALETRSPRRRRRLSTRCAPSIRSRNM